MTIVETTYLRIRIVCRVSALVLQVGKKSVAGCFVLSFLQSSPRLCQILRVGLTRMILGIVVRAQFTMHEVAQPDSQQPATWLY